MEQQAKIIEFNKEIAFDDIKCVLNSVQSCDLKQILFMTPEDRRLEVALAFTGLSNKELFGISGFDTEATKSGWWRWLRHENRLPLGAAFRLAKVFGVPAEVLFESPKWRGEE